MLKTDSKYALMTYKLRFPVCFCLVRLPRERFSPPVKAVCELRAFLKILISSGAYSLQEHQWPEILNFR